MKQLHINKLRPINYSSAFSITKLTDRAYYLSNCDKIKNRTLNNYYDNKQVILKKLKNYYKKNRPNIRAKQKEYYNKNKTKFRERNRKNRIKKK